MNDDEIDALLMPLASRCKGVEELLDVFFGFMNRRTDFYVVIPPHEKNASMGFSPGQSEKMVLNQFRKRPFRQLETSKQSPIEISKKPDVAGTRENSASKDLVTYNEKGDQVPIGNGGMTDRYWWIQSLQDVTITICLSPNTPASDIKCLIKPNEISISVPSRVLLHGTYPERVRPGDCFWSVDRESDALVVTLEKVRETWWNCVVEGDPCIDTQKVDSSKRVDEYDEKTQAAIRKVMFDQHRKSQGLPTSDDIIQQETFEKVKRV